MLHRARNIEAHPVQSAAFRRSQLLQAIFTGVCCVLLTALSVCGALQLSFTEHLAAQTAPLIYALIHIVLLTGAILVCRHTVLGGIRALLCRSDYTGADGMIGMMMMACLAQSVVSLFHGEALQQGRFVLYGAVGLFILCMNAIGRLILHNRIRQLEKMMDGAETVETARLLREESRLQKLIDEHIPDRLTVYVQPECEREVVLANAAEPDGSQRLVARLTVPLLLAALIVAVVALVFSGSGEAAWSAFTASLCVCAPATAAFCMNIPMSRLCKRLAKYGASVASWSGVSAYGETGCAVIHDAELFSGEAMALKGIKTIREERLEVAIPAAAAVLRSAGGPMRSLFDRMVREAELELPQAEQVQTEDGGVIGWVRGRRVLIGSGKMLEAHGVKAPSRDYEAKNCPEDMHFVYLAFGGELVAMFILEYTSDDEMYEALVALAHAGCDLTVLTTDANVTESLIRECFGLPAEMLQLIPRSALEELPEPEAESNAQVVLTGGGRSLLRALALCVRSKPMMELASALQLTGMVLGLILLAVFAATGAIHRIGIGVVFLFDLFWMAAVTAVPSLKKL